MKTIIKIATAAALLIFAACTQSNFEPAEYKYGEKVESTTTIKFLEETYMVTASTTPGYYTADKITSDTSLVFNGIVLSNDMEGNQYKYISVLEDNSLTTSPRAIRISIDANNIANIYPTGQRVSVIVNDLCIGKYGNTPQIGTYYPRPKDGRISPGGIPMPIVREKVIPYNKELAAVVPQEMTIPEIKTYAARHHEIDWKLITIKNIHFTGKGESNGNPFDIAAADKIFAPGTNNLGYPQLREIQDPSGNWIFLATSEFANFSRKPLPASSYVGDITCIVSWYQGKPGDAGSFQLTLRALRDLGSGFTDYLKSIDYIKE